MNRPQITLAAVAAAVIAICPAASGHYKHRDVDDRSSDWFFRGQTYKDDKVKDPINFIIYGAAGSDTLPYSRARIEDHFANDWVNGDAGGHDWRKDSQVNFFCKDEQRMYWRNFPGESNDKNDWHGQTPRLNYCGNQHHARFWDDYEHASGTDTHGAVRQWAVGGIHHEKIATKLGVWRPKCCLRHKVDRDWDVVRRELVEAMAEHCSAKSWKYHPGADGVFQKYDSFGFIARLSLHHVSDGGCRGQ